ncbi:hypothetical protein DV872_07430 [Oceanispirochaeta sp. M1]|nr:hypothetical protein DV872_07430 [Oceanispirochaeta sp. M1]
MILLITMIFISISCSEKETRDLFFFYFESCPSCDDYKLAEDFNKDLLLLNKTSEWNARHYNLIAPEAGEALKKVLGEKGLPDISRSLPLLIIGDEYINGYENIGKKLDDFLAER